MTMMTYAEAKKAANRANPKVVYEFDAGNNCVGQVYYCPRRNRQIFQCRNKNSNIWFN